MKNSANIWLEPFKFRLTLTDDSTQIHNKRDIVCMLDVMMRFGSCHCRTVRIAQFVLLTLTRAKSLINLEFASANVMLSGMMTMIKNLVPSLAKFLHIGDGHCGDRLANVLHLRCGHCSGAV